MIVNREGHERYTNTVCNNIIESFSVMVGGTHNNHRPYKVNLSTSWKFEEKKNTRKGEQY